ncbi:hypothetical protein [Polyangium jinanense]|uniref:Lipoprotein n=1 Tax=Polyangium jinanense TaxID=2829994 RepID=A0A9X3XDG5_9BACT|nr:hypothetical protein [Polyangium jinanense]MDC3961207.1 hypothetical protein [Polyangium jinanense]MDC3988599.1 hypothetical protein [Polyangium jinanense]
MKRGNEMRALWMLACVVAACGTVERKEPDHVGPDTPSAAEANVDEGGEVRTQKPGAPVKVEGRLASSSAVLTIDFEESASEVSVEVWGVDGLVVTSAKEPVQNREFGRGEKASVEVSFTAPATRADLAVRVRGTFDGRVRERVQSFTVNAEAPSLTQPPGEVRMGPDGRPVRVMRPE